MRSKFSPRAAQASGSAFYYANRKHKISHLFIWLVDEWTGLGRALLSAERRKHGLNCSIRSRFPFEPRKRPMMDHESQMIRRSALSAEENETASLFPLDATDGHPMSSDNK